MLTLCVFELLPLLSTTRDTCSSRLVRFLLPTVEPIRDFRAALSLSIACCFSSRAFSSVFEPSFLIRSSVRSADALIRFWCCRWRFWREVSRRAANNSLKESTLSRSVMGCALKITRSISKPAHRRDLRQNKADRRTVARGIERAEYPASPPCQFWLGDYLSSRRPSTPTELHSRLGDLWHDE